MRQDRERVTTSRASCTSAHADAARGGGAGSGGRRGRGAAPLPLPPLGPPVGADVASSRVHYLYFLSSFLLLKTALRVGRDVQRSAQDVFEIVRNEVPLEEWPTYIFTRTFSQRKPGADAEIAALKAVAKPPTRRNSPGEPPAALPRAPLAARGVSQVAA